MCKRWLITSSSVLPRNTKHCAFCGSIQEDSARGFWNAGRDANWCTGIAERNLTLQSEADMMSQLRTFCWPYINTVVWLIHLGFGLLRDQQKKKTSFSDLAIYGGQFFSSTVDHNNIPQIDQRQIITSGVCFNKVPDYAAFIFAHYNPPKRKMIVIPASLKYNMMGSARVQKSGSWVNTIPFSRMILRPRVPPFCLPNQPTDFWGGMKPTGLVVEQNQFATVVRSPKNRTFFWLPSCSEWPEAATGRWISKGLFLQFIHTHSSDIQYLARNLPPNRLWPVTLTSIVHDLCSAKAGIPKVNERARGKMEWWSLSKWTINIYIYI